MPSVCLKENRILHYSVWILIERILYLHAPHLSLLQGPIFIENSTGFRDKSLNKLIPKLNIFNCSPRWLGSTCLGKTYTRVL